MITDITNSLSFMQNLDLITQIMYLILIGFMLLASVIIILSKTNIKLFFGILIACMFICLFMNPLNERAIPSQQEFCDYVQNVTPEDAIILTDPYESDWRLCLNRAIVVDYKSIPFEDNAMIEWYNRINDVTYNSNLSFLKEKYGVDYMVFDSKDAYLLVKVI